MGVKLARHENRGEDSEINEVVHSFVFTWENLGAKTGQALIKMGAANVKKVLRCGRTPPGLRSF